MTLSSELERLLPRLRRFARAATADKTLADQCVEQALKAVIQNEEEGGGDKTVPGHVRLYRSIESVLEKEAGGSFQKRAWRALILVCVEEFDEHEAGLILGVETELVREMVRDAEQTVHLTLQKGIQE